MAVSIGQHPDTARRAGGEARFSLFFRDEREELRDERGEFERKGSRETGGEDTKVRTEEVRAQENTTAKSQRCVQTNRDVR
jgi:hypothetical protein